MMFLLCSYGKRGREKARMSPVQRIVDGCDLGARKSAPERTPNRFSLQPTLSCWGCEGGIAKIAPQLSAEARTKSFMRNSACCVGQQALRFLCQQAWGHG